MISNILNNDIYCGTLRTHKKKTISIRGKAVKLPEEENFVFENHHEAIISKETFELAKQIKNRKAGTKSTAGIRKRTYCFSGLCRCGDCGCGVSGISITRKNSQKGYECSKYRTYGKARCKCHEIKEIDMLIHFKQFLKFTKEQYLEEINSIQIERQNYKKVKDKEKIERNIEILQNEYKILINQKIKDLMNCEKDCQKNIIENTYKELEFDQKNRIEYLQNLSTQEQEEIKEQIKNPLEYFEDIIEKDEIDRYVFEYLINKVCIYHDKSVIFELKPDITNLYKGKCEIECLT